MLKKNKNRPANLLHTKTLFHAHTRMQVSENFRAPIHTCKCARKLIIWIFKLGDTKSYWLFKVFQRILSNSLKWNDGELTKFGPIFDDFF